MSQSHRAQDLHSRASDDADPYCFMPAIEAAQIAVTQSLQKQILLTDRLSYAIFKMQQDISHVPKDLERWSY